MCHLAGYVGNAKPNDVLNALERQEIYLGGQATGLAWKTDNKISISRAVGPVSYFPLKEVEGHNTSLCIGHSRFTAKSLLLPETNTVNKAHPFLACDESFSLSHNGEIVNANEIKAHLSPDHVFESESFHDYTDSEVIVHLLEEELKERRNMCGFSEVIQSICGRIEGYYLLTIINNLTDQIFLGNWTQPLVIGAGPEGSCFASLPEGLDSFPENLRVWKAQPSWNSLVILKGSQPSIEPLLVNRQIPNLDFDMQKAEERIKNLIYEFQPISFHALRLLPNSGESPAYKNIQERAQEQWITFTGYLYSILASLKRKGEVIERVEHIPEAGVPNIPRAIYSIN